MYSNNAIFDEIMKDNLGGSGKDGMIEKKNKKGSALNPNPLEFMCVSASKTGFVLGGNRGTICMYNIEKNLSILNQLSFEMTS